MNGETLQVLLVESNVDDMALVRRLLAESKDPRFELTIVDSFSSALRLVRNTGFDVVLLGLYGLGSLDGFTLAAPRTPIIVLGQEEGAAEIHILRHGAQDYLVKGRDGSAYLRRSIRHAIERKAYEVRLAEQANFDSLTGLANRALFQQRLQHSVARAKRTNGKLALMFIDLDGFKSVNDTLGHDAGDQVLRLVADQLRRSIRQSEAAARLGGDEFTVLLDPVEDAMTPAVVAKRILDSFQSPLSISGREVRVTPSIGIALYPDQADEADTLLRYADAAMFRAKSLGRNNFQMFTPQA